MPVDTSSKEYLNFADIKATASIPVILASLGLLNDLERKDDELIGRCMLDEPHGKDDSFAFNTRKGAFQCFACKKRGSILDFVAKHLKNGCTLRESAQYVYTTMRQAENLAGEGADDEALTLAIANETDSARSNEKRFHSPPKPKKKAKGKPRKDKGKKKLSEKLKLHNENIVIEQALDILRSRARGQKINSAKDASGLFILELARHEQEVFTVLFLDGQLQFIAFELMFYGSVNAASVHPREVAKKALLHNACAIICGHNHPSGVLEPSESDVKLTHSLKDAMELIDVRLIDHIIVGAGKANSLADRGII